VQIENRAWIAALALVVGAAACSSGRQPSYEARNLATARIETIAVAPVVDARADKFHDVEVLAAGRRAIERALSEKRYSVVPAQLTRRGEKIGADEVARMSEADLAAAAPKDVRYLLIPSVDSIVRDVGELGKTIDIKVSGRLIDLGERRELWRDTAEGDADLSGLLTVLTGPAPDNVAALDAARSLFSTLPEGTERAGYSVDPAPVVAPLDDTMPRMRPAQER
jgi:hypothetical protein